MGNTLPNINEIHSSTPADLAARLAGCVVINLPQEFSSPEALKEAAGMLGNLTNTYSYLMGILMLLKAETRKLTRKDPEYNDAIGRKEAVQGAVDILEQEWKTISRMITVHDMATKELEMLKI